MPFVDPTEARNSNGRIDDAPAHCSDGGRAVRAIGHAPGAGRQAGLSGDVGGCQVPASSDGRALTKIFAQRR